jgi:phytoene dehydrogenase-like protein
VGDYLERFDYKSDLLKAMYAVTDGFSGLNGTWDSPRTGMNFLVHNMCRLPGSDGTWMIVEGGMGAVTQKLRTLAEGAGAHIRTGAAVKQILVTQGRTVGVALADGAEVKAKAVVVNADPFRMLELLPPASVPEEYRARIHAL